MSNRDKTTIIVEKKKVSQIIFINIKIENENTSDRYRSK